MKYLSLVALCALQLALASAAQARSPETGLEAENSSPWYCLFVIASNDQNQSETEESEQQTEEEPDCE